MVSAIDLADEIERIAGVGRGDALSLAGFVIVCAECLVRGDRYRVTASLLVQFAGFERSWAYRRLRRLAELGVDSLALDVALAIDPRRRAHTIPVSSRPRTRVGTSTRRPTR